MEGILSLEGFKFPQGILDRSKYEDVGMSVIGYGARRVLFDCNVNIVNSLASYSQYLRKYGISCYIGVECNEKKLFCIESIYMKFVVDGKSLEVAINVKDNEVYRLLEQLVKEGTGSRNTRLLRLYESYWKDQLVSVFNSAKMNYDVLYWE